MKRLNLYAYLAANPYPGRGIFFGCSRDGQQAYAAYFIMGRSENSRNRVFTEKGGSVVTEAADPEKMQDPSLVIYTALRRQGPHLVVTNGDQTDTVHSCLERDIPFEEALRTRTFEPDAPNLTPRISGLLSVDFNGFWYKMSVIKSAGSNASSVQRFFYEYPQPLPGEGHLIHTYMGDGQPLPSFTGEPVPVELTEDFPVFGQKLWGALHTENKVSLLVRRVFLDGNEETVIYNQYNKV